MSRSGSVGEHIHFSLRINPDFSWSVTLFGDLISSENELLRMLPQTLASTTDIDTVIRSLDSSTICSGNNDKRFMELAVCRKGVFKDSSGMYNYCTIVFFHQLILQERM